MSNTTQNTVTTVTTLGTLGASSSMSSGDSGCGGSDVSLNISSGSIGGGSVMMRRVKKLRFHLRLVQEEMLGKGFDPTRDTMFVSGASQSLGAWQVHQAVEMRLLKTPGTSAANQSLLDKLSVMSVSSLSLSSISSIPEVYSQESPQPPQQQQLNMLEFEAVVEAPLDLGHIEINADTQNYKYFFAQKTYLGKDKVFLKQVEYAWRKIPIYESHHLMDDLIEPSPLVELNDKWSGGEEDNKSSSSRVDFGWLSNGENEFQFHFYSNPIQLWAPTLEQKNYWIDIKPWRTLNGLYELKDYVLNYLSFDSNQSVTDKKTKFNSLNYADCYTSLRLRTFENPGDLLFQINLHEIDDDDRVVSEKIVATGYFKVSKTLIDNSLIHDLDISLLDQNQIIGTLKTEILLITSTNDPSNSVLTKNYNYHFNRSCVPIGHRGMGKTFDAEALPNTTFVENTIESFREAYHRGAQMVEFDIVLTKDKIPIVYHDFVFCVDQLADRSSNNYLSIAVNQLTYEEVKQSRIYSHKILKNAAQLVSNEAREVFTSKLMFPTLKEMCQQLDPKLGFNVEVKYPIDLEDGSNEIDSHIKWLNRNEYIDVVIKELYKWCSDNQRCVIITTFDPNLCSMIRMKQSKFPVLFLTNGVTNKWKPYKDWRCKNTQRSVNYAKAENLHGIVAHAEELTANLHLINILFNNHSASKLTNFLAYSWGDELNEIEKRKLLSQSGINGIIYDRINESSTNESD